MSGTAARAWIEADWPAPANVRALTTTRHGLGVSQPPFDHFNLGARCGDAPEAVAENRRQLAEALGLPSPPRWLRQVHGVGVVSEHGERVAVDLRAVAAIEVVDRFGGEVRFQHVTKQAGLA